jgi:hypothetical protein
LADPLEEYPQPTPGVHDSQFGNHCSSSLRSCNYFTQKTQLPRISHSVILLLLYIHMNLTQHMSVLFLYWCCSTSSFKNISKTSKILGFHNSEYEYGAA